jgi:hypothetical protein
MATKNKTVEMTAEQALEAVRRSVANPKPETIVLNDVHSPGEYVRQGDIYIRRIEAPDVKGMESVPSDWNGQLAEGTGKGSRHIIDRPQTVKAYRKKVRQTQDGYVFKTGNTGVEVTHPDHGHVKLGANCWFEVFYQVNLFNSEKTRVQD